MGEEYGMSIGLPDGAVRGTECLFVLFRAIVVGNFQFLIRWC